MVAQLVLNSGPLLSSHRAKHIGVIEYKHPLNFLKVRYSHA